MEGALKLCLVFVVLLQGTLAYTGYQVFNVIPTTQRHIEAINNLEKELGEDVSVWNDKLFLNKPVIVHASPKLVDTLTAYLEQHGLIPKLIMEDMAQTIRDQVANRRPIVNPLEDFAFDQYHPLEEIEDWMRALVDTHSDVAELLTIGYSYNLHPIYAIRVSTDLSSKKPVIWLDAGIHANEWVGPATMVYIINRFLEEYQTDEVLSRSLETHDWYFMAVYNVDGYMYTWEQDGDGSFPNRLWRKTRTPNPESACVGTDPNRNWDIKWGTTNGISFDPCSNNYCGSTPWSEPCVRQVVFYLRDQIDVDVYIAYHSFGEFFMLPYGYTDEKAEDFDELMEVCARATSRVQEVHGKDYDCDSLINLVGENSGSSVDYMYDVVQTKFSFAVELRDNGTYGFLLPADQILPNAEEHYPFVHQVVKDFLDTLSPGQS